MLLAHYLGVGPQSLPSKTQDKRYAADLAIEVLTRFREDLIACYRDLDDLSRLAAEENIPVTPLRILELLAWSEVEPRGYYRG